MAQTLQRPEDLRPYVPRLLIEWLRSDPRARHRSVPGTLAFVDISGFTKLTERLARRGKVGAEEMNDVLDRCFAELLAVAYADGAGLVKWGGDAVLLLFEGDGHAPRAARAAREMQRTLRRVGRVPTSSGTVVLRMSVGVHSAAFDFVLAGDIHRELLIVGPDATRTVEMESAAEAGEVVVSPETASVLPDANVGEPKGPGFLLRGSPLVAHHGVGPAPDVRGLDLSQCLPLAIREHLAGPIEPEHRQVAVAFVEFKGTDELIRRDGADGAAALGELIEAVQEETRRHEVTFFETDISADGGKIMLVTGAPRTAGQDEERMLAAARRIVARAEGTGVPVRIGINAGRVFSGNFGPRFRRTYSIKGDAVNLAARVMGKASPGQVLATEAVVSKARSPYRTTALAPFLVKGKSKPVLAFDVGPVEVASSTPIQERGVPLVGRESEMAVLREALEDCRRRRGRVVELVGEPGHGKSRLAAEAIAKASDLSVLTASCQLYEQQAPYFPIRVMLRDLLGLREGDDADHAARRLRRRVETNAADLVPWLPLLGIVTDVPMPPTPETEALADEFRRMKLHEIVVRFLETTLPTPTLFVIEDAHWMDDASTDLVREIARTTAAQPWLLLVTRRDEEGRFRAPLEPHVATIPIGPLDAAATAALARAATEDDPIADHDLEVLIERAGGNPLFLQELVAAAREAGSVDDLPGSVEALVAAEIDRLSPADRAVLRQAAVLGNELDLELVGELYDGGEAPSPATWRRLAAFVVPDDEGTIRFTHALVRDAAYEGLPYRRRRELHARAARAIERAASGAPEERAEVLSLHYHHAAEYARSLRYSTIAADRALSKFALVESASFYLRAIEAARREDAPAEVARLSEALGDVQERIGRYGDANVAYRAARRATIGDPLAQARLLLKQAWIPERAGRYSDALRWIRRGQRSLEGMEGEEAMRLRAQLSVWYAAVRQGQGRQEDAIRWCRVAIEQAEAVQEWDALAQAYFILDWAYVELGRYGEATNSERALEIYERLGNLGRQATIWNNLGGFAYWRGRWDEALELYEKARSARLRLGDVVDAARGTNNIGEVLSDQGHLDAAEELFRETLRVWKAAKFSQGVALVHGNLGRVASRSGRYDEAEEQFALAIEGFARIGAETDLLEIEARIAESYVFQGRFVDAIDRIGPALVRARAMGGVGASEPALVRLQGRALLGLGRVDEAMECLLRSLELSRQRESEYDRALALLALADAYRAAGADPEPSEAQARAILTGLGVVRVVDAGALAASGAGVVEIPDAADGSDVEVIELDEAETLERAPR